MTPRQALEARFDLGEGEIWESTDGAAMIVRPHDVITIVVSGFGATALRSSRILLRDGTETRHHLEHADRATAEEALAALAGLVGPATPAAAAPPVTADQMRRLEIWLTGRAS